MSVKTDPVRPVADDGNFVTPEMLSTALAGLESRLIGWGVGIAFLAVSSTVAILRLMG